MLCPCGQEKGTFSAHSILALDLLVYFVIAFLSYLENINSEI